MRCETYGIDYIFGLSGNVVLDLGLARSTPPTRISSGAPCREPGRGSARLCPGRATRPSRGDKERRVVARIEASASHADDHAAPGGIDIRYVVTSLPGSDAEHIYETIYCACGQSREPHQAAQGTTGV